MLLSSLESVIDAEDVASHDCHVYNDNAREHDKNRD